MLRSRVGAKDESRVGVESVQEQSDRVGRGAGVCGESMCGKEREWKDWEKAHREKGRRVWSRCV